MKAEEIKELLQHIIPPSTLSIPRERKVYAEIPSSNLRKAASTIIENDGRFVIIAAFDAGLTLELSYHFDIGGTGVVLKVEVPKEALEVPSISDITPAAGWAEREASELTGVKFIGNPRQDHLVLPEHWEEKPMEKPFQPPVDEKIAQVAESIITVGTTAPLSPLMEGKRAEAGLSPKPPAAYTSNVSLVEIQGLAKNTSFMKKVGYDPVRKKLRGGRK